MLDRMSKCLLVSMLMVGATVEAWAQPTSPQISDLWCEADDVCAIYVNGVAVRPMVYMTCFYPEDGGLSRIDYYSGIPLLPGPNVIAAEAKDRCGGPSGFIAWMNLTGPDGSPGTLVTDGDWRVTRTPAPGWESEPLFDDSAWTNAAGDRSYSGWPIHDGSASAPPAARWIWDTPYDNHGGASVYFRRVVVTPGPTEADGASWGSLKLLYR